MFLYFFRACAHIPRELCQDYYKKQSNLKLYVRRVMITDEFDELLPRYLGFIKVRSPPLVPSSQSTLTFRNHPLTPSSQSTLTFRNHPLIPSSQSTLTFRNHHPIIANLLIHVAFAQGVVDSDSLPLNVSREMLQQNKVLKVIGKKMTRKALAMIKSLADAEQVIIAEIISHNRRDHES